MPKKGVKVLSRDERTLIEMYVNYGMSYRAIGRELNRAHNCIMCEIKNNGGRNAYTAEKAHQRALFQLNRCRKVLQVSLRYAK